MKKMSVYIVNSACNWGLEIPARPYGVCLLRHEDKKTVSVCLPCGEIYGEAFNKTLIEMGRYNTLRTAKYARKKLASALENNYMICVMPPEDV